MKKIQHHDVPAPLYGGVIGAGMLFSRDSLEDDDPLSIKACCSISRIRLRSNDISSSKLECCCLLSFFSCSSCSIAVAEATDCAGATDDDNL